MIRWGLCCMFRDEPIRFRDTTAAALRGSTRPAALARISGLCLENAAALLRALQFCAERGIGCFRVKSQILPLKTHPQYGYAMDELPDGRTVVRAFQKCGDFARKHGLRTCFHPDQFVVLNSPRAEVVAASIREIEYQAEVAQWIGADVINVHGGGAYGDKGKALAGLARGLDRLSAQARARITIENDDRVFSPADLLPLCRASGIPLVYDVHHHRCHPDQLQIEEATRQALATWDREPLFHISTPLHGWNGPNPERHHEFIDPKDFPSCWRKLQITVEVEAKAKELAVLKLKEQLEKRPTPRPRPGR